MARLLALGAVLVFLASASAVAQERADLKRVSLSERVVAVTYCGGSYSVKLEDGTARQFDEYNLSFKIDTTAKGPSPGASVLVPAGRMGDRAIVVFAALAELKAKLSSGC